MPYAVEFEFRKTYLFAKVTGDNSGETVFGYMREITERCDEEDCFRILIYECLDGQRLAPMDVFKIVSECSMQALGKFDAIAYVDENMGNMAEFAENVAINRGMPIKMFTNLKDAIMWIEAQNEDSDSQRIFRGDTDIG